MAEMDCGTSVRQSFHNDYIEACDTGSFMTLDGKMIVESTIHNAECRMNFQICCDKGDAIALEKSLDRALEDYIRSIISTFLSYQC